MFLSCVDEKKRRWLLVCGPRQYELELIPSSVTNKFKIVSDLIEEMKYIEGFENWFSDLLSSYFDTQNSEIVLNNADKFIEYASIYIEDKNIDYSGYTRIDKISKTSIVFDKEHIKSILVISTALKLYSILKYDKTLRVPEDMHKEIYNRMVQPCIKKGSVENIYKLVRSRVCRSLVTDRRMWDFLRLTISESPESYMLKLFDFLMVNLFGILSVDKNPIPCIVSVIDDSLNWTMRSVFKDKFIYGETFGGLDDIYGESISKESFLFYCCNDVIGKAAKMGLDLLENEYIKNPLEFEITKKKIEATDYISSVGKMFTLLIASKVLEIPYRFIITCPPKHSVLIGVLMYYVGEEIAKEYPNIYEFLPACIYTKDVEKRRMGSRFVKSSYKLKNSEIIINDNENTTLFGFEGKLAKIDILKTICGIFAALRREMINTATGGEIINKKISYFDLERDVILFFSKVYNNSLEYVFSNMRRRVDELF